MPFAANMRRTMGAVSSVRWVSMRKNVGGICVGGMCQTARSRDMASRRNGAGAVCVSAITPRPASTRSHIPCYIRAKSD